MNAAQSGAKAVPAGTELPEQDEQYRSIFEATTDALLIADLEGFIVEANPAACQMYGYAREELIGLHGSALTHPDYHHIVTAALETIKAGGTFQVQTISVRKDGTPFNTEGRASAFTFRGKLHVLAAGRDVTERVRTEEQLREKEEQYRRIFESSSDGLIINDPTRGVVVEANPAVCRMHGYTYEEFIGLHGTAFIHPDYHPVFVDFLETIMAGGTYQTQAMDLRKDGSVFYVEVHGSSVLYKGRAHILAVVRDITERVLAEERMREKEEQLEQRVEERTRELATLLDVSHDVASTLELQPLLGLILDKLKIVVDYNEATVVEWNNERLRPIGYRGPLPPEVIAGLSYPALPNYSTWQVIGHRKTVIIDDVQGDSAEAQIFREVVGAAILAASGMRCWMSVPMVSGERVIGLVSLSHKQPDFYTPRHASLAGAIANQAAIAIENARLYEKAQEAAVLEERQRLSRELHDSVSQALYGIALGAQTARALVDHDPGRVREPLEYVLTQAERGLAEMRALILELRPEALETEGLAGMLDKQGAAIQARHGLTVQMDLAPEPEAPLPVKEALYRIAQEALHNAVKHAQATTLQIALARSDAEIVLEIQDNGKGFDTTASYPGHIGLHSMRERAARLGGTVQVGSTPGAGTRVCARIPHQVGT